MEATKFLLIVVVFLASSALDSSEARWVRLNDYHSPVCFRARGEQYGTIPTSEVTGELVKSFLLNYRWGSVSCNGGEHYSKWGCWPNNSQFIGAVITDQNYRVLAPRGRVNNRGWYSLPGFTSSSSALLFRKVYTWVYYSTELRLWYGEDLKDYTDNNNYGKTCADVYAEI